VFSGSVSSDPGATEFRHDVAPVTFHSFVQSDDEMLNRFCTYMKWEKREDESFAILSEDETAYGGRGPIEASQTEQHQPLGSTPEQDQADRKCADPALKLYYPRDISALRGAY